MYIGLDIGGTKILAARCDTKSCITKKVRSDTPADLEKGMNLLHEMIGQLCGNDRPDAIAAAIGAPLDHEKGIVSPLHQPQWRNVPLKKIMEDRYSCRFDVDVDTNVAAVAEYELSEKYGTLLYVTVSTGIGAGLIVEGKVYRGSCFAHPEPGHQSIKYVLDDSVKSPIECTCGAKDCLEALVSGRALEKIYNKQPQNLSDEEWTQAAYNLGQGLRNMAVFYTPDVIVLGGSVALKGPLWWTEKAAQTMTENLKIVKPPAVKLTELEDDGPLKGALLIAENGLDKY